MNHPQTNRQARRWAAAGLLSGVIGAAFGLLSHNPTQTIVCTLFVLPCLVVLTDRGAR